MGSSFSSSASTSSQRTASFIINTNAASSPSSTFSQQTPSELNNYEVFINFRGKDIRDGFLSFLFESLKEKGIDTFKDEKLKKGTEITPALKQTIQESCISIVIFSKNYADSPWCLDELVVINECREKSGQIVLPVFYRVDPTDVQELRGPFARALARLLKDHSDSSHNLGGWCHALKTISNDLSAFVSNEIKNDQTLVQRIVNRVSEILSHMPSNASYHDKLIGIDSRVEEVISLLDIDVNDRNWIIGIWGMAGIGKTTLAGSSLYGKEKEYWESQLLKLKSIPNKRIQDVLKISYDGLDRNEQIIFLDIACFFGKGDTHENKLEKIIESFGFFARCGIRSLIDKSLIAIRKYDRKVEMHNLLQQMGEEIVNEECKQPGGRRRLGDPEDISHVFKTNTGTDKIECISFKMSNAGAIEISSKSFMKMPNLRFLRMSGSKWILPDGLDFLPEELRYLRWYGYPLKSLPLKFCPNNLVQLRLPGSQLKHLWDGDSKGCEGLTKLPPLSGLNCLRQLYLNKCGLSEIPKSIGSLLSLEELHLDGNSFETIPASIKQLSELKVLDLSDCKKLRNLPELPWLMSLVASNCTSLEFISYPFLSLKDQDEEAFVKYIYVKHGEYLDFLNCIKLGKDVCLKIMETALSGCLNKKKFRLYIPWVEVLPRMRYWTSECHLSFKLEREDILGFCFCAVIDPQLLNSHRSSITCLAKSGKIYDFHFPEIELMSKELDSKHVFLLYKTLNCECFTQASFQFAIEDYDYNTAKYVQVSKGMIKCGVHPISWKQYRTRLISKLEMIKTKKDGIGIRE
ncbi:hypothetical protein JCGZ_04979 [Jatropha curcas]|uniref:TIR domain-containing protein n=1 Tax=Jatropha curcas TaxID=180498 RepID=A0A067KRT0_JATCU|nr:hypothetical protein JCGZ_04979 [Jatropha curcas]